jgi:hypothetical protein
VPGNRFDHVIRLAGLEESGDHRVAEVVETQAGQAGLITQRSPRRIPLARWLRGVQLVMLPSTADYT